MKFLTLIKYYVRGWLAAAVQFSGDNLCNFSGDKSLTAIKKFNGDKSLTAIKVPQYIDLSPLNNITGDPVPTTECKVAESLFLSRIFKITLCI